VISGNDLSCSYCAWENVFSDTLSKPGQNVLEVIYRPADDLD
jgi:hypothetical protein